MDNLPDLNTLSLWLTSYGSFALFGLLALGIIALPVPEETLMVIAGILMSQGTLQIHPTILAALGGSVFGITVSYLLGKSVGYYFLHKYGSWFGITEERIHSAHDWFERYGKWTLLIGYFIPGVRHLTGISAGASSLEYRYFALFAYTGAVFWVATFLSFGYFFGPYGLAFFQNYEFPIDEAVHLVILALLLIAMVYFFIKYKKKDQRNK